MRVESYSFGRVVVDGVLYTSDLILYPNRVDGSWWRKEGHRLDVSDLERALATVPEVLIIGTGWAGLLRVPAETLSALKSRTAEVQVVRTAKAVDLFNEAVSAGKAVVAALHLTC